MADLRNIRRGRLLENMQSPSGNVRVTGSLEQYIPTAQPKPIPAPVQAPQQPRIGPQTEALLRQASQSMPSVPKAPAVQQPENTGILSGIGPETAALLRGSQPQAQETQQPQVGPKTASLLRQYGKPQQADSSEPFTVGSNVAYNKRYPENPNQGVVGLPSEQNIADTKKQLVDYDKRREDREMLRQRDRDETSEALAELERKSRYDVIDGIEVPKIKSKEPTIGQAKSDEQVRLDVAEAVKGVIKARPHIPVETAIEVATERYAPKYDRDAWLQSQRAKLQSELNATRGVERLRKNMQSGALNIASGLASAADMVNNIASPRAIGGNAPKNVFGKLADVLEKETQMSTPESRDIGEDFFGAVFDAAAKTAPYVAAGSAVAASAPAAGLGAVASIASGVTFTAAVEGGNTYRDAKNAGIPENKAQLLGVTVGAVNGTIEYASNLLGLKLLTGKNVLASRLFARLTQITEKSGIAALTAGALGESLEEVAQELVQEGGMRWAGAPPTPDFWKQLRNTAVTSGVIGGVMGGGGFVGQRIAGTQQTQGGTTTPQAEQQQNVEPVAEAVEQSAQPQVGPETAALLKQFTQEQATTVAEPNNTQPEIKQAPPSASERTVTQQDALGREAAVKPIEPSTAQQEQATSDSVQPETDGAPTSLGVNAESGDIDAGTRILGDMDERGALDLTEVGKLAGKLPSAKKVGQSISDSINPAVSIFAQAPIVEKRASGTKLIQMATQAESQTQYAMGEHRVEAHKAIKSLDKKDISWMQKMDAQGISNFQKLFDYQPRPVKNADGTTDYGAFVNKVVSEHPSLKPYIDVYWKYYTSSGDAAEQSGIMRDGKPFQSSKDGRYIRYFTPEAMDLIENGGKQLDDWAEQIKSLNPELKNAKPFEIAESLKAMLGVNPERKVGALENYRTIKVIPAFSIDPITKDAVQMLELDPVRALQGFEMMYRRSYLWKASGGDENIAKLRQQYATERRGVGDKAGNTKEFDNVLRDFYRRPQSRISESLGFEPTSVAAQLGSALNRTIGTLQTLKAFIYNVPLVGQGMSAQPYIGTYAYVKGHKDALLHPKSANDYAVRMGAIDYAYNLMFMRKGMLIKDVPAKLLYNVSYPTVYTEKNFVDIPVAMGAKAYVETIRQNGLPESEVRIWRDVFKIDDNAIVASRNGEVSEEIESQVVQGVVRSSTYMTEYKHLRGKLSNSPILSNLFSYNLWPTGRLRHTFRTMKETVGAFNDAQKALRAGNKRLASEHVYRGITRFTAYLVTSGLSGAAALALRRAIAGRPLKRDDENWKEWVGEAFIAGALLGPIGNAIFETAKYNDNRADKILFAMMAKFQVVYQYALTIGGHGTYGKMPLGTRLAKQTERSFGAVRDARRWSEKALYGNAPQDYDSVRSMAWKWEKQQPDYKEPNFGDYQKNPELEPIKEAMRLGDIDMAIEHTKEYIEVYKGNGETVKEMKKRLTTSLNSARPVDFADKRQAAFLNSLPQEKKRKVSEVMSRYEKQMKEVMKLFEKEGAY